MVTVTNFPASYTENPGYIVGGASPLSWTNPSYCMVENAQDAVSPKMSPPNLTCGYYWAGAFQGNIAGPALTTSRAWSAAIPPATLPDSSQINDSNFGFDVQYTGGGSYTKDLFTYNYAFSVADDIISVNAYIKHWWNAPGSQGQVQVDSMKITVVYTARDNQSPSSNGYSGGPMMFKSPRDLLRVLKKPLYTQTASPRKVCASC
jgi:hypothetical protein